MRFAYADPPYPGQAWQYRNHPDYAGEVDHGELIARLERDYPDGWALSTYGRGLPVVLKSCPHDVRVAIWHVTNAQPLGALLKHQHWMWSWEALIVRGGRVGDVAVKDVLSCGSGGGAGRFVGRKPELFCMWMFELLGARRGDELVDLFPGSGAVSDAWRMFCNRPDPMIRTTPDLSRSRPELAMRATGQVGLDGHVVSGRTWKSQGSFR